MTEDKLSRFIDAQAKDYQIALSEIRSGKKLAIGCGIFSPRWQDWG